jgi:putative flippase GtrA
VDDQAKEGRGSLMKSYIKTFLDKATGRQFATMATIGVVNTIMDFGLVKILLDYTPMDKYVVVTGSALLVTGLSYLMNKRITFGQSGLGELSESASFYLINFLSVGVTNLFVWGADLMIDEMTTNQVLLAKVFATGVILFPKFAGYRDVVFGGRARRS